MKPSYIRNGLIGILLCLVILNFYKTKNLCDHPDYPYDARNVFIAGQLLQKGLNPYNDSLLKAEWVNYVITHRTRTIKPPGFPDCGMIYPFWSIPILIPYYLFSWPFIREFIWILSWFFVFVIAYFSIKSFADLGLKWWIIPLFILAFKSSFVAVVLGQPLLMSMAALMASWYFYLKNKDTLSGFLLGLAVVKVTICIPFIILFLINKKWKLLLFSAIFPFIGAISFYAYCGSFFINEMLANMAHQMQLNYAEHSITAVNTNLTEVGILFNYFFGTGYKFISGINIFMVVAGSLVLVWFYIKGFLKQYQFLALLIIWHFLFSYHLIYDCLILIFLVPLVKTNGNGFDSLSPLVKTNGNGYLLWIILLAPLFIPVNGIFTNTDWIKFHLPVTLLALFLYLVYDCYRNYTSRNI